MLTNDLFLQAGMKEVQSIIDLFRQTAQIQPDVKCRIRHVVDLESHVQESSDHIIALVPEMVLQSFHLIADFSRFQHGHSGFLKWDICASVKIGAATADRFDEFFGAENPSYTLEPC